MPTYETTLADGYKLQYNVWQASQSQANNTSVVSWSLYLIKGNGTGKYAGGPHGWSIALAGFVRSGSIGSYDFRNYTLLELGSGSETVPHDSNGYKTVTGWASYNDNDSYGALGDGVISDRTLITLTRIPKAPGAPSSISASRSERNITVSWGTSATNGGALDGYTVQYRIGSGSWQGTVNTSASDRSHTYTNLALGTTYTFRAYARNVAGSGATRVSSAVSIPDVPGVPPSVTAARSVRNVTITYSAPSNGGSGITGYELQYSKDGGSWTGTASDSSSPYTFSGLTAGSSYKFRVRAKNAMGAGGYRETSTVAIPSVPDAPASLTLTKSGRDVRIVIGASPSNGGATITSYRLSYSSDGGTSWSAAVTVSASGRTHEFTGLDTGTYRFRADAVNEIGASAYRTSTDLFVSGGGRINTGDGTWRDAIVRINTGDGVWRDAIVKVNNGDGTWKDAI